LGESELAKYTHNEPNPRTKKPIIIKCIVPETIQPTVIANKIMYFATFDESFLKIMICRKNKITKDGISVEASSIFYIPYNLIFKLNLDPLMYFPNHHRHHHRNTNHFHHY